MVTMFSCGEAGVQVRIGDDFETVLNVAGPFVELGSSAEVQQTTSINSELKEYGDFITDVEITQLTLSLANYSGSTTGQVVIEISGETFTTPADWPFVDGSSYTFPNSVSFANVASQIENGEVSIGISCNTDAPFGDNDFDFVFVATVLATAKADPI